MTDFQKDDILVDAVAGEGKYRVISGPVWAYVVHDELDGGYKVIEADKLALRQTASTSRRREALRDAIRTWSATSGANPIAGQLDDLTDHILEAMGPCEIVDDDGDTWTRQGDGQYKLTVLVDGATPRPGWEALKTVDQVREQHGVKEERW